MQPFKILHILRAPVGGLFRHVTDLARGQAARGHSVGIIADASTGAARAEAILAELAPSLALGIQRIPMSRHLGLSDLSARNAVAGKARASRADVIHGHGAKGGAYVRLAPRGRAIRVYTPHGGSLHYRRTSPLGFVYLDLERLLMPRTDLFLFESAYGGDTFAARVGQPRALVRVVHNGVADEEFAPVAPGPGATELVFVGELRKLKGVDVLLDAIAQLARQGRSVSLTVVGEGPDEQQFRQQTESLGLTQMVDFAGAMPARAAFTRGRVLVVPSRAESLPYIVLEAAAAGIPLIATAVGGIPEILGPDADHLVPSGDAAALARAIAQAVDDPQTSEAAAQRLRGRIRAGFSVDTMTDQVLAGYAEALAVRQHS